MNVLETVFPSLVFSFSVIADDSIRCDQHIVILLVIHLIIEVNVSAFMLMKLNLRDAEIDVLKFKIKHGLTDDSYRSYITTSDSSFEMVKYLSRKINELLISFMSDDNSNSNRSNFYLITVLLTFRSIILSNLFLIMKIQWDILEIDIKILMIMVNNRQIDDTDSDCSYITMSEI